MATGPKDEWELLEERATIDLPRLALEELRRLFEHLAEHLPATVSYSVHEDNITVYGRFQEGREEEGLHIRQGELGVCGSIHTMGSFSFFKCRFDSDDNDIGYAIALRFDTAAFNRVEEFRKDEVQLWDNVKQLVRDYLV
jgi:hypothetical protein